MDKNNNTGLQQSVLDSYLDSINAIDKRIEAIKSELCRCPECAQLRRRLVLLNEMRRDCVEISSKLRDYYLSPEEKNILSKIERM